jgi:hypothetical protein
MISVTKNMNVRDQFFMTGTATVSSAIAGTIALHSPIGGALCGMTRCVMQLSLNYIDSWISSLFSATRPARVAAAVIGLVAGVFLSLGLFYLLQLGAIGAQGAVLKFVVLNLVMDVGLVNILRAMNWAPYTA